MKTGMDLKVDRIRAKVTQQQIADHIGLSRSWVAKTERIDAQLPAHVVSKYEAALRTFLDVREIA